MIEKLKQANRLLCEIASSETEEISLDDMAQIRYWLVVMRAMIKRSQEAQRATEDVSSCDKE